MGTSCTIKKIKVIESMGKIEIDCTNTTDKGEDDLKGLFAEAAAPDFYRAMDDLRGSVAGILEAPELAARLKPFAVTYHYGKDGRMGAIISAKLALPMAWTETVVNTPMRKCPIGEKPGGAFFDDVRIYDRALSPEEVRTLTASLGTGTRGPVLPATSPVTVVAGATLAIDAEQATLHSVSGAGTVAIGAGSAVLAHGWADFAGSVAGPGTLLLSTDGADVPATATVAADVVFEDGTVAVSAADAERRRVTTTG